MESQINFQKGKDNDRNYGIDLLRIVSMFHVCLIHILGHGGVIEGCKPASVSFYLAWIIEISAFCAVNCYALISGYVGVNSKFRISNLIYLWIQVAFYSVTISLIFRFINPKKYSWLFVLQSFLPVTTGKYWYFTAYFGMFLFIPFLQYAITHMQRQKVKFFLGICLIIVIVFSRINSKLFGIEDGYSVLWLMILYLTGGYIRKYNLLANKKTYKLLLSILGLIMVTFVWKMLSLFISSKQLFGGMTDEIIGHTELVSYLSPTIFLIAVFNLIIFSRIKFKKSPQIITALASVSFGVYLLHEDHWLREVFIVDKFNWFSNYNPILFLLMIFGTGVLIYSIGFFIDYLRLLIFRVLRIKELLNKTEDRIIERIEK